MVKLMYEPFSKGDNLTIKKWFVVQYEYVELLLMPPELRRAIILSTVLGVRRAIIISTVLGVRHYSFFLRFYFLIEKRGARFRHAMGRA